MTPVEKLELLVGDRHQQDRIGRGCLAGLDDGVDEVAPDPHRPEFEDIVGIAGKRFLERRVGPEQIERYAVDRRRGRERGRREHARGAGLLARRRRREQADARPQEDADLGWNGGLRRADLEIAHPAEHSGEHGGRSGADNERTRHDRHERCAIMGAGGTQRQALARPRTREAADLLGGARKRHRPQRHST